MQCKDSTDELGVFFNHTEGIHRPVSGFTNVAESDKLNLMSLSWRRRIQPGCQSLVSARRAKNFALAAVKAALFHFPHNNTCSLQTNQIILLHQPDTIASLLLLRVQQLQRTRTDAPTFQRTYKDRHG
jgi:hypothetical protein